MTIKSFSLLCFLSFWVVAVVDQRWLLIGLKGPRVPVLLVEQTPTVTNCPNLGLFRVPCPGLPPPHLSCLEHLLALFPGHIARSLLLALPLFIILFKTWICSPPERRWGRSISRTHGPPREEPSPGSENPRR